MNNEEAIKQINLTKQRVNEGSKAFRDQIDNNVLPLVKEDEVVTGLIKGARHIWTFADRGAKAKLEEAKARISKPTVKPRLDPDMDYRKTEIIYSLWFFMGGFTLRTDYPNHPILGNYLDEYFEPVIDYIAEHDISNVVRVEGVASFGSPPQHPDPLRYHLVPHPMKASGLFDLHTINKEWKDQQIRRLEYIAERGIMTRYIFNCQSSIRGWFIHYLNHDLNDGWNGRKTYEDYYGWCHCWHYAGKDPMAIREYREGTMTEERAWELIHQYEATRDYLIWFREYVVKEILEPFKPFVMWDNNEIEARSEWHGQEADFLNDVGYGRARRITSVFGHEWFHTASSIPNRGMGEQHGINTVAEYDKQLDPETGFLRIPYVDEKGKSHSPTDKPILPCADGYNWDKGDVKVDEIAKTFKKSLIHRNGGFQGNGEGNWKKLCAEIAAGKIPNLMQVGAAMRDEKRRFLGK